MPETLNYRGTLVVETCWCGIHHAVPQELFEAQEQQFRDGEKQTGIFCPLGHSYIRAGKGEAEKLKERLEAQSQRTEYWRKERERSERKLSAAKGQATKLRKRAAGGACPCCNRTYVDVARHMATKHPDYANETKE